MGPCATKDMGMHGSRMGTVGETLALQAGPGSWLEMQSQASLLPLNPNMHICLFLRFNFFMRESRGRWRGRERSRLHPEHRA